MTPMTIYLAGPMTGIPHFNFPAFHAVAAGLRALGHTVFNPAEKDIERHAGVDISAGNIKGDVSQVVKEHGFSLRDALAEDCEFICREADAIALLPGWERSFGAIAEHALAVALRHTIMYLSPADITGLITNAQDQKAA
jgi:hypothetical protein